MDKIHVTDSVLNNAAIVLKRFADQTANITTSCVQQLSSLLPDLETNFRDDVSKFMTEVQKFSRAISACMQDNLLALSDRLTKLTEYASHYYSRNNMG